MGRGGRIRTSPAGSGRRSADLSAAAAGAPLVRCGSVSRVPALMPPTVPNTRPIDASCPACGATSLDPFHVQPGVPQQANLLLPTRDEALALPTGDLRLAFCPACGFVTNTAFDAASQDLSARYEASQGFSATFNAFAERLARRWADRYALAGGTAVEIGCGKGEFLAVLCRAGGCRGVGFDPTLDPKRLPPAAGQEIEWVADRFDARAAGRPMDFVCCRHTLEHVPDVGRFLGMVRDVIGPRAWVRAGFEVPDALRVLRDGAFWDLYYEHCSYFTAASLRGLFERAGFEVLDASPEFDGQYLVIEARPALGPRPTPADHHDVAAAVADFPRRCRDQLARWREVVDRAWSAGRRVTLWGASSKAVGFLTTLDLTHDRVPVVVDINPHKRGSYLPASGCRIVGPADLAADPPDLVIAMNPIYRDEITRDLRGRGIGSEVLAL